MSIVPGRFSCYSSYGYPQTPHLQPSNVVPFSGRSFFSLFSFSEWTRPGSSGNAMHNFTVGKKKSYLNRRQKM